MGGTEGPSTRPTLNGRTGPKRSLNPLRLRGDSIHWTLKGGSSVRDSPTRSVRTPDHPEEGPRRTPTLVESLASVTRVDPWFSWGPLKENVQHVSVETSPRPFRRRDHIGSEYRKEPGRQVAVYELLMEETRSFVRPQTPILLFVLLWVKDHVRPHLW